MEEKLKKFLENGELYSALGFCLGEYENSTGIEKQKIRTVLDLLVANDEVLASVDDSLRERYEKSTGTPLDEPAVENFVGKAAFPVYNESGSSMVMMEVKDNFPEGVIGFSATDESKGSLFDCLKILWYFIQKNLKASDLSKNDVTVTNWGFRYTVYTNPEVTGRLATPSNLIIDGGSFQFAAFVASISKVTGIPVNPGFIFTGSFESSERLAGVEGIPQKAALIMRERPGFKKIVIPSRSYFSNNDKKFIAQNEELFLEVNSIEDLVEVVFGKPVSELLVFSKTERHKLGVCRIIADSIGIREIELYDKLDGVAFNKKKYRFNVVYCSMTRANTEIKFNIFPIPEIAYSISHQPGADILFVIDYPSANTYLGNFISNNSQTTAAYSIGIKKDGEDAQIFAHRQGSSDKYIGKYYLKSDLRLGDILTEN